MTDDTDKPRLVILPEAQEEIAKLVAENPGLGASMSELFANFHQAMEAVSSGQYATFDDAMEAIRGERPIVLETSIDD